MAKQLPLTNGGFALVDDEDYGWLSEYRWRCSERGYVRCVKWQPEEKRNRHFYMAREIMQPGPGQQVDHIDRDKLNNTRANLRCCTPSENTRNCPPLKGRRYKGVYLDKRRKHQQKPWTAQIGIGWKKGEKKIHYLGTFATEEEAARAYDTAARQRFGEFASTNFPVST